MNKLVLALMMVSIVGCGSGGYAVLVSGQTGATGPQGVNGLTSIMTQVSADSSVCSNGGYVISSGLDTNSDGVLQPSEIRDVAVVCNGLNGATGSIGATGATGASGANGTNGTNGVSPTPVTIVNLCPGVNAYPTTFIEVGICLNNKLYGVYSANGGFMTYLSNGNWSSDAIGSSCNLTINGCTVTH